MDNEKIARIVHQTNKIYCESLGDNSQKNWEDLSDEMKASVISGVEVRRQHPMISAAQMHNHWLDYKVKTGWVFGTEKDETKKTHPNIKPYHQLPAEQRAKDGLFLAVVSSLLKDY